MDHAEKTAEMNKIFDPVDGFGHEGEWKKLKGVCLEREVGECVYLFIYLFVGGGLLIFDDSYIYEVCLFGEVKQKPVGGGQEFSLGCVPSSFLPLL